MLSICSLSSGSPPPTRGTRGTLRALRPSFRITPAYAGNTVIFPTFGAVCWDHPRLRGEHSVRLLNSTEGLGSPPPTRGTPKKALAPFDDLRITPAYAGNTVYVDPIFKTAGDHPRLRGEHYRVMWQTLLHRGSPPPTRGTLS